MGAEEEKKGMELEQAPPTSGAQRVTQNQFLLWKQQKDADASARKVETERKRAQDVIAGTVPMNGRELFLHEPWVFDNTRY